MSCKNKLIQQVKDGCSPEPNPLLPLSKLIGLWGELVDSFLVACGLLKPYGATLSVARKSWDE
eukprot:12054107-Ditylum_brightwellii.AAC.1